MAVANSIQSQLDEAEAVIRAQMGRIAELEAEVERLRAEGGAHAALKSIYLDPDVPQSLRAKAAIGCLPHEVPKIQSVPPVIDSTCEEIEDLATLVHKRRARQDSLCPESRGDFKALNLLPATGRGNGNGADGDSQS